MPKAGFLINVVQKFRPRRGFSGLAFGGGPAPAAQTELGKLQAMMHAWRQPGKPAKKNISSMGSF
jgi:hypothetical protein